MRIETWDGQPVTDVTVVETIERITAGVEERPTVVILPPDMTGDELIRYISKRMEMSIEEQIKDVYGVEVDPGEYVAKPRLEQDDRDRAQGGRADVY